MLKIESAGKPSPPGFFAVLINAQSLVEQKPGKRGKKRRGMGTEGLRQNINLYVLTYMHDAIQVDEANAHR